MQYLLLMLGARAPKLLNCVDLFAGAGGFSLGARLAGLKVMLAIDVDQHAVKTYRANLCLDGELPITLCQDISTLSPELVRMNVFRHAEPCDLLLGGPPCQGFSTHRINDAGVNDQRNDLIHVYFDFVKAFLPKVFLMENVPGMLWQRHSEGLSRFYREGALAGYKIKEPVIIDARNYGVPQRRKRVFILGLREDLSDGDLIWPPGPTHGNITAQVHDPSLLPWKDCSQAFEPPPEGDPNDIHMKHGAELIATFAKTPLDGGSRRDSGRILPCHRDHDGHKDVYGRIDSSRPAPTMTTACINPSKGRFVHPNLHHGITVRQAARIQTFPDDFVFHGGLISMGAQVGNAVPVELARVLIEHIKQFLTRTNDYCPPNLSTDATAPFGDVTAAVS